MKKHYTKKQITEAIAHWQSILKKIDESKSALLDAFADKFGNDVVFSVNDYKVILPSLEIIKNIYDIANQIVF